MEKRFHTMNQNDVDTLIFDISVIVKASNQMRSQSGGNTNKVEIVTEPLFRNNLALFSLFSFKDSQTVLGVCIYGKRLF